jgi:hypothetical protein
MKSTSVYLCVCVPLRYWINIATVLLPCSRPEKAAQWILRRLHKSRASSCLANLHSFFISSPERQHRSTQQLCQTTNHDSLSLCIYLVLLDPLLSLILLATGVLGKFYTLHLFAGTLVCSRSMTMTICPNFSFRPFLFPIVGKRVSGLVAAMRREGTATAIQVVGRVLEELGDLTWRETRHK